MRLHRIKMRSAHHAGHIMSGQRESHRKMAADRAGAEDAYSHGSGVLFQAGRHGNEFPRACSVVQPPLEQIAKLPRSGHDRPLTIHEGKTRPRNSSRMQTDQLLAGVVILSLFGLAMGRLINLLETRLLRWRCLLLGWGPRSELEQYSGPAVFSHPGDGS